MARGDYERALHYLQASTEGWQSQVRCASSLTGEGVPEVWEMIGEFRTLAAASGALLRRRQQQERDWMHALVEQQLRERFRSCPAVVAVLGELEAAVMEGRLPATTAARRLLDAFTS